MTTHTFRRLLILAVLTMSRIPMAEAQTTVGGHIGVVFPLVTHAAGTTTNIATTFLLAFRLESPSKEKDAWPTISSLFPECKVLRG